MPDATPTSIAPPSPARRSNRRWVAVQFIVTAIVLLYVGRALVKQWRDFQGAPLVFHPRWSFILASGVIVLLTYAVLIETLRRILLAWGGIDPRDPRLSFLTVARLWSISNLGRYLPGKIWGIGAMAGMAQQAGVGGVAAAGSAVLNTIVNIGTGFVVALVASWSSFDQMAVGNRGVAIALAVVGMAGLLMLPALFPRIIDTVRRITGRQLSVTGIPHRAVYIALAGNVVSWLMYGAAFMVFVFGVIPTAQGSFANFVSVWAWPYIVGYLAILAPGGIGVRDGLLAAALVALGMATPPQALLISVTSRLWLMVLELLPGLLFLAGGARPRSNATHSDGSTR